MAVVVVKVLTEADSYALLSLDEVKILLDVATDDTSSDAQMQMLIDQNSDTIAVMLNRVLGKEMVRETWTELGGNRIFVTRWPLLEEDIVSIEAQMGGVYFQKSTLLMRPVG